MRLLLGLFSCVRELESFRVERPVKTGEFRFGFLNIGAQVPVLEPDLQIPVNPIVQRNGIAAGNRGPIGRCLT